MTDILGDDVASPALAPEFRFTDVSPWVAAAERPDKVTPGWYAKFRTMLLISDTLAVSAAVVISYFFLFQPEDRTAGRLAVAYSWLMPAIVVLWVLALCAAESCARRLVGAGLEEYRRVISASVTMFGLLALASYVVQGDLSRALFVTTLPLGISLLLVGRWVNRQTLARLRRQGRALTNALVVGTAETVADVVNELGRRPESGYRAAGACVVDGRELPLEARPLTLRDVRFGDLHSVVRGTHYGAVIVADGLTREQTRTLAWRMENRPLELMFVPRAMDVAGPRLSVHAVEGLSFTRLDLPVFTGWRLWLKRAFDVVFSAIALALLAPLFLVVAVAIKLDDGGPVLFRQTRIGRYGKTFTIHKFRTMCVDAESKINELIEAQGGTALLFKLEDDPRITRVGKFLRKYSIDELPQFWTALRGGMSVVGPRPQVAREVAEYTDVHHRRLLIKPGITGLWQVNGRSELSMEESIRLDLRYVENWSLIGDVVIILKTVGVVVRPDGAY